MAAWRESHRGEHRQGSRDWYWANAERARAAKADEYRRTPEKFMARNLVRKGRLRNQLCDHGASCVTATFLTNLYASACIYCGQPAEHADHFVPLARGGLHCTENLVPACQACNSSKKDRDPGDWMASLM